LEKGSSFRCPKKSGERLLTEKKRDGKLGTTKGERYFRGVYYGRLGGKDKELDVCNFRGNLLEENRLEITSSALLKYSAGREKWGDLFI